MSEGMQQLRLRLGFDYMIKTESPAKYLEITGLIFVGLLFFIWPIPHSSTIRIALIILSLLLAVYLYVKHGNLSFKRLRELRLPVIFYFAFTVWIFFLALFISDNTLSSLDEINGQWLRGAMAIAIGALFAHLPCRSGVSIGKKIFYVIFWVLALHALLLVFHGLYNIYQTSEYFAQGLTFRTRMIGGLASGPLEASCLIDILMSIVLVEIIFRVGFGKKFLPVNIVLLSFLFCISFLGSYLTGFRNFFEISVLCFLTFSIIYFARTAAKRKPLHYTVMVAAVIVLNIFIFYSDKRWQNLWETVPLAFDTVKYTAWRQDGSPELPKLSNGETVNISNYLRLAWVKEGVLLVADYPLGVGFGKSAFKYGMEKKSGYHVASNSHSGIIDMAIGTGVPGVILWMAILLSLIIVSFKRFLTYKSYYALVLFFLCTSFAIKTIVDNVSKDHMLQQFFFVVGLLAIMMIRENDADLSQKAEGEPVLED